MKFLPRFAIDLGPSNKKGDQGTVIDKGASKKVADRNDTSIVPFGLGSSLEGHVIPYDKGITIDFTLINKVVEIREKDFLVKVQPGVTRSQLNKELKKYGLFFTVDPGADATLGGMAATNASGTTSVKYGIMKDQVNDLEVVLPDGEIIHTGNMAQKSSSGYNLTSFYVGSEGTLGCITELTLRVYGIPENIMAARASFPTVDDAVEAVVSILQTGVPVARVELVDEASIRQVNSFSDVCVPISELAGAIKHGREKIEELDFEAGILGHVGDGNYHALLMSDTDNPEEVRMAEKFNEAIVEYALACGGTCTGEHGVGRGKMKYLKREHGSALNVMGNIKSALDPKGIMNPHKLIDTEGRSK